jgi:hypothetical protein
MNKLFKLLAAMKGNNNVFCSDDFTDGNGDTAFIHLQQKKCLSFGYGVDHNDYVQNESDETENGQDSISSDEEDRILCKQCSKSSLNLKNGFTPVRVIYKDNSNIKMQITKVWSNDGLSGVFQSTYNY